MWETRIRCFNHEQGKPQVYQYKQVTFFKETLKGKRKAQKLVRSSRNDNDCQGLEGGNTSIYCEMVQKILCW